MLFWVPYIYVVCICHAKHVLAADLKRHQSHIQSPWWSVGQTARCFHIKVFFWYSKPLITSVRDVPAQISWEYNKCELTCMPDLTHVSNFSPSLCTMTTIQLLLGQNLVGGRSTGGGLDGGEGVREGRKEVAVENIYPLLCYHVWLQWGTTCFYRLSIPLHLPLILCDGTSWPHVVPLFNNLFIKIKLCQFHTHTHTHRYQFPKICPVKIHEIFPNCENAKLKKVKKKIFLDPSPDSDSHPKCILPAIIVEFCLLTNKPIVRETWPFSRSNKKSKRLAPESSPGVTFGHITPRPRLWNFTNHEKLRRTFSFNSR